MCNCWSQAERDLSSVRGATTNIKEEYDLLFTPVARMPRRNRLLNVRHPAPLLFSSDFALDQTCALRMCKHVACGPGLCVDVTARNFLYSQ